MNLVAFSIKTKGVHNFVRRHQPFSVALAPLILCFGCWPDGRRAALAISGDIDSVTVQDFFLRILKVH